MNKKVVLTIVILVLLVLALGGYIAYDKIYLQYFNEESAKTVINDVPIDVNDLFETGIVIEKLDRAYGDSNSTYFGYLYELPKRLSKVSELETGQLLYAAMYDDMICSDTEQYISESKVKSNLNNLFGTNAKYKAGTVTAGTSYIFNYDETTKLYTYKIPAPTSAYAPAYIARNISTTIENDTILVTRKVFYVEYELSGDGKTYSRANIYKARDKKEKLITLNLKNGVLSVDEVFAKTASKMKTYLYTFNLDVNGYKLYSIERK